MPAMVRYLVCHGPEDRVTRPALVTSHMNVQSAIWTCMNVRFLV